MTEKIIITPETTASAMSRAIKIIHNNENSKLERNRRQKQKTNSAIIKCSSNETLCHSQQNERKRTIHFFLFYISLPENVSLSWTSEINFCVQLHKILTRSENCIFLPARRNSSTTEKTFVINISTFVSMNLTWDVAQRHSCRVESLKLETAHKVGWVKKRSMWRIFLKKNVHERKHKLNSKTMMLVREILSLFCSFLACQMHFLCDCRLQFFEFFGSFSFFFA